jgi:CubicO group peptidase (beta-lactamase class C family)
MRLLLLAVLVCTPAFAEVPAAAVPELERVAMQGVEKARIPALSVAVMAGEGKVWKAAYGFADLENFVPATPESSFRLASIGKLFTATAAMKLVEEGKLDLDAPIQKYVKMFPEQKWPVTLRLLLCHQGGVRHYKGDDFFSTKHFSSTEQALSMFARDPLLHEPGTKFAYSSYGYNLIGAAIESASGRPYAEYVKQAVLEPALLRRMQVDDVYTVVPRRVRGYRTRADGTITNCALADTSNKVPAGGWTATAEDLILFARAVMDGNLVQPESIQLMWTPVALKDGKVTGYGLGFNVTESAGVKVVQHSGGQQGANTHLLLVPEKKIAIAVLANLEDAGTPDIAHAMLKVLLAAQP